MEEQCIIDYTTFRADSENFLLINNKYIDIQLQIERKKQCRRLQLTQFLNMSLLVMHYCPYLLKQEPHDINFCLHMGKDKLFAQHKHLNSKISAINVASLKTIATMETNFEKTRNAEGSSKKNKSSISLEVSLPHPIVHITMITVTRNSIAIKSNNLLKVINSERMECKAC